MPDFIAALCTLAVSTVVSTFVGLVIKRGVEHKLDRAASAKEQLDKLREEQDRRERREALLEMLRAELKPTQEQLDKISLLLAKNNSGTVSLLRERLNQSHDEYMRRGKISATELANWHHLINTYEDLGGNHFREYVDEWKNDVENLPRDISIK